MYAAGISFDMMMVVIFALNRASIGRATEAKDCLWNSATWNMAEECLVFKWMQEKVSSAKCISVYNDAKFKENCVVWNFAPYRMLGGGVDVAANCVASDDA